MEADKNITLDDLLAYVNAFNRIKELEEKYKAYSLNRKEIANEIRTEIESLHKLGETLEDFLSDGAPTFYQDYLTDIKLAFELILRLANQKGDRYGISEIHTPVYNEANRNGDIVDGVIYVIGDKELLHSIDNKKKFHGQSFGKCASKIIDEGNSLIIFGKAYDGYNAKASIVGGDKCSFVNIKVSGFFNSLTGYLYDDELGNAMAKFKEFIDQNGADIKGIPIDILFEYISKQQNKTLTLNKKDIRR